MASLSTNLLLSLLAQGESNANGFSHWGDSANSNFEFLEDTVSEVSSVSVTTADVTLSAAENRSLYLSLSGTLTGDRAVIVAARKGFWMVYNGCTGAYTLTVKTSAGTGIVVQQGETVILYCNGTNVIRGNDPIGPQVLQTVRATRSTADTTTSATLTDTGLTASITRKVAGSTIKCRAFIPRATVQRVAGDLSTRSGGFAIKNQTDTVTGPVSLFGATLTGTSTFAGTQNAPVVVEYEDTGSTTTAIEFRLQFFAAVATNLQVSTNADLSTIYLELEEVIA